VPDIGGSTVIMMLTIPPLFTVPQQIQGFATDDVTDFDQIQSVETMMGVDGILSAGFVWVPQMQTIRLQADSPSCDVFDVWYAQQTAGQRTYAANGVMQIPSIQKKFVQTSGFLTQYKLPGVKKLVQPRTFGITWNLIVPAPSSI
jgi:hypothetical protein